MGRSDDPAEPRQDQQVVAALIGGDSRLFAELVDAWSPSMLRIARHYVSNQQAAEDVVQEAWMAALRGLAAFQGRSSLRTWVCGIVLNLARRHGSREHRLVPVPDPSGPLGPTVSPDRFQGPEGRFPGGWKEFPACWPSPEEDVVRGETHAVISAALQRLPDRQRLAMELRDVQGYDAQEVADILGISVGNQRVLLHRARSAVRRELELYFAGSPA